MNDYSQINQFMENPANKLFLLIYMEGCGPCNATRPNWNLLYDHFKQPKFNKYKNIAIADIEQSKLSHLHFIHFEVSGFPTMKIITNKGNKHTDYENSNILLKDRSTNSFIQWIHSGLNKKFTNTKKRKSRKSKKSIKNRKV